MEIFVWYAGCVQSMGHSLCLFNMMEAKDLLLDKQELTRNKVLKVNKLRESETMDVSVRRQFESEIFRFLSTLNLLYQTKISLHSTTSRIQ